MSTELRIVSELKRKGVSVTPLRSDGLPHLLAGYAGETYLLFILGEESYSLRAFIEKWQGRKVYAVSSPEEAAAICGVGDKWVAWRIERERILIKSINQALRYKGLPVNAEDVLPWQDIYETRRGLSRCMVDMAQRGMLTRISTRGYLIA